MVSSLRHCRENPKTENIDAQLNALFEDLKTHQSYTYKITEKMEIKEGVRLIHLFWKLSWSKVFRVRKPINQSRINQCLKLNFSWASAIMTYCY